MPHLRTYPVWDVSVRWFHWINLLCVLGLVAVGVAILNDKALGVDNDGKILLKTVHVWIGYVFVLNLVLAPGLGLRRRCARPLARAAAGRTRLSRGIARLSSRTCAPVATPIPRAQSPRSHLDRWRCCSCC